MMPKFWVIRIIDIRIDLERPEKIENLPLDGYVKGCRWKEPRSQEHPTENRREDLKTSFVPRLNLACFREPRRFGRIPLPPP
jgi:hypothetical protein